MKDLFFLLPGDGGRRGRGTGGTGGRLCCPLVPRRPATCLPLMRADSPVSGGNVRTADKGGAGPAGLDSPLGEDGGREQKGLSIRQISRLTSISKKIVERNI